MDNEEKTALLREIHHRVKNNFQIIISLIELQTIKHPENNEVFLDLGNRVRSMSLIYENLLLSKNINQINFSEYIKSLIDNIKNTYGKNIEFKIHKEENIFINIEQAIPVGVTINELLMNACKHAFIEESEYKIIEIKLQEKSNLIKIHINDNGVGISDEYLNQDSKTLGLNLITMLIKEQLKGLFYIKNDGGIKTFIQFEKA